MRILITGIGGFVGRHLVAHLRAHYPDAHIHGTILPNTPPYPDESVISHAVDLRDPARVAALVQQLEPAQIYHLAAQASPRRSFSTPWETIENNVRAQLNITLACIDLEFKPRMLVISSAEIYDPHHSAIDEDTPLLPTNPYGVSKVAQDMLAVQYHASHGLPIMRARPFNHFGPGQNEGFVAPDFAIQIARIEAGAQPPVIEVGNLAARRDFTDVRDIVSAYHLIIERGQPGAVYNIATGAARSIEDVLTTLLRLSDTPIEIRVDPARFMPVDVPVRIGDSARLRAATGWEPHIPFDQSLGDLLIDCRQRVRAQRAS